MTLVVSGTLETEVTGQYLHTLFRGKALRQFYLLSADEENIDNSLTVYYLITGFSAVFFSVNSLSKTNRVMHRCMK